MINESRLAEIVANRMNGEPEPAGIEKLLGHTLVSVVHDNDPETEDAILFTTENGRVFRMHHNQDCCESVYVESVTGDLNDLVGSMILMAEESTSDTKDGQPKVETEETRYDESTTWTFYKLATQKGYVDIRWCGSSNGYYSEGVDIEEMTHGNET